MAYTPTTLAVGPAATYNVLYIADGSGRIIQGIHLTESDDGGGPLSHASGEAFAAGLHGLLAMARRADTPASPAGVDDGEITTLATDDVGRLRVAPGVSASEGLTRHAAISAASTNATLVKASAGVLGHLSAFNTNAAARWLKLYNAASAPTAGSGTPAMRIMVPGGGGVVLPIGPAGIRFTTGIGYTIVTGAADTDATAVAANEVAVNIGYV